MSPRQPEAIRPDMDDHTDNLAYHAEKRAGFNQAVDAGLTNLKLEQWDHNQRLRDFAKWKVGVQTDDMISPHNPNGMTGEDAAYLAKLREMHEDGAQEPIGFSGHEEVQEAPETTSQNIKVVDGGEPPETTEPTVAGDAETRTQDQQILDDLQVAGVAEAHGHGEEQQVSDTERETIGAKVEKEKGNEKQWTREAINPENIIVLQDQIIEAILNADDDETRNNPFLAQAKEVYVQEQMLHHYLQLNDREWDSGELAKIRNSVIKMLGMNREHLEMLMLKPEDQNQKENETKKPEEPLEPSEPVVAATTRKGMGARFRDGFRRGWNAAYVGALSPVAYLATRGIGQDKDGKPIIAAIPEGQLSSVEPEGKERKRRCFWPVLGALALGGAAGYLIARGFHGGGGGGGAVTEVVTPKGGGAAAAVTEGHGNATNVKEHLDTWNNTQTGHRYVQDVLPDNLDQRPINGISGPEGIFDKTTGQPVVEHVTFKASGALSDESLQQLHKAGYNTDVIRNQIFDTDRGPGPVGLVDGRWTSVVASNTPKS